MKVIVRKVDVKSGINTKTGEAFLFTNAFVIFEGGQFADHITIDSKVCDPNIIKPGMKAEVYFSQTNKTRATFFEPIGVKSEEKPAEIPGGYTEVNPADYELDPGTGEMVEKNKN